MKIDSILGKSPRYKNSFCFSTLINVDTYRYIFYCQGGIRRCKLLLVSGNVVSVCCQKWCKSNNRTTSVKLPSAGHWESVFHVLAFFKSQSMWRSTKYFKAVKYFGCEVNRVGIIQNPGRRGTR